MMEVSDWLRPLNERGYTDAIQMFDALKNYLQKPELVITSPALRAHHTTLIAAEALTIDLNKIKTDAGLYLYQIQHLINTITSINDNVKVAMVVGHNPHFEQLATIIHKNLNKLPTTGLLEIKFDARWQNFNQSVTSTKLFTPATYRNIL